ncbi:hypothetical protein Pla163_34380 [Planctomycetes bacterium Pla163]|uniref:SGNH hydrolase-type esterase domain-containing protein n=1 Tax=Rohdeia mirabilis TaxID=2528008 RepID=A0A518D483_9BACT|nr:hypothetical protein Pla163_34380 [Planctomycetes bacterium Pla163]
MRLKHFTLLLWIALFLVVGEVALEYRAKSRGFGTLLLSGRGLSGANNTAVTAEHGFGPTEDYPFRSRVVPVAKPAGTTRIWIASASYAEDRRWAASEIFPVLLEDELRARGHDVQVLNASSNAYSLATAAKVLHEEGPRWQPDLVLAYHFSNDLDELAPRLLAVGGGGAPNATESRGEGPDGPDAAANTDADEGTPRTEQERWITSRVVEATTAYAQAKNQFKARIVALRILTDRLPPALLDALEERVEAVHGEARALGADFVPVRFAVSDPTSSSGPMPIAYRNNLFRYNSYLSEQAWRTGVDDYNALLVELAARDGLDLVGLDAALSGNGAYFRDFCHLTREGHAAAAKALADQLEPLLAARANEEGGE